MKYTVSKQEIEAFADDGAICLRGVFEPNWIEKIKIGISKNRKSFSRYAEQLKENDTSGVYFNDYCNWRSIPEFEDYVMNSPAADVALQLMQSSVAIFYHEHVLVKDRYTPTKTPWHQDQPYYPIDGDKNCSIWMPVDPVASDTSVNFIRGSHKLGWFHPRYFATHLNKEVKKNLPADERIFQDVPDIDKNLDKFDILQWNVQPGDCVVFHMRTLHAAPSNMNPTPRRVLSTRWLGDDAVIAERPWDHSPPLLCDLKPGDPAASDEFPVIRRAC